MLAAVCAHRGSVHEWLKGGKDKNKKMVEINKLSGILIKRMCRRINNALLPM